MRITRFGAISAAVLIATIIAGIVLFNPFGASLKDQISQCFERYTKGLTYKKYIAGLVITEPIDDRTSISASQLACAMEGTGFTQAQYSAIKIGTEGRFDNKNFRVSWKTRNASTFSCLPFEKYRTDKSKPCIDYKQLAITITDFR